MSHSPPSSYPQSGFTSSASMAERNDLHDMSPDDLELECQHLRDENHQLQLRILGVNELARLLQDRSELVQVLEEKNKRLEIAVVRLENRCANYDRTLKSQKGANVPTAKPGQSPFIPGPSRQILEGLMKENSDLKKTVSNLTGKGAAGYLEAVKATQLEEVIDQQKQEIEFLKDQINQLTSTGIIEEKGDSSLGQLSSLPANVSDTGPLKRQLIQLQRAMKVKDRFCTLLSQQVSQLQNRLATLEFEAQDGGEASTEPTNAQPQQESSGHEARVPQEPGLSGRGGAGDSTYKKLYEETKDTLVKEREDRMSLVEKMSKLENQLKDKGRRIDELEQRCDEFTSYHQTLLMEKTELNQKLENLSISGSDVGSPRRSVSEPSTEHLKKELKRSSDQILDLRAQLENANVRAAIADSKLGDIENKHAQAIGDYESSIKLKDQVILDYQSKVQQNELRIADLDERVKDLEEDIRTKESQHKEVLREILESKHSSSGGGISSAQMGRISARSGGAPTLFGFETTIGPDEVTTPQHGPKMRNPPVQVPLLSRDSEESRDIQKQPPNNLNLHSASQQRQPGRSSPAPHTIHQPQLVQSVKGTQQQQLQTPATPVAPNQAYTALPQHQAYTHPLSQSGSMIPSSMGGVGSVGYNVMGGVSSQMMFGAGSVSMGQPSRMQQGGMTSRPRTMPMTSPSPTPGSTQRTFAAGVRTPFTTNHPYSGVPGTTYSSNMGVGSAGIGTQYSGMAPTSYGGGPSVGSSSGMSYGGARHLQRYTSGGQQSQPVFGGMSSNSHASNLYSTSSAQLPHQQQFQQPGAYSRADSGSSGYASGDISYSAGIAPGSGMRPTSPRAPYSQQNPPGGYAGAQGGLAGQFGMRPTSPRSGGSYDSSGSYQGGQGGGTGGQHGFPPRGH